MLLDPRFAHRQASRKPAFERSRSTRSRRPTRRSSRVEIPAATHRDLLAARIISFGEVIRFIGGDDPTSRILLESILATEEEHADDLAGLLDGIRN